MGAVTEHAIQQENRDTIKEILCSKCGESWGEHEEGIFCPGTSADFYEMSGPFMCSRCGNATVLTEDAFCDYCDHYVSKEMERD